jgi:DNA-binding response OmpR family regulator
MDKIRVAIIEDDTFLADMYATKFELEGFDMHVANNGEDGLALVKKVKPDLILLDVLMPKMNGFEVLSNLRSDAEFKDTPVILLTNLGQKEDVDKGLEMGAQDYLIKAHFVPSEVVQKVKALLGRD